MSNDTSFPDPSGQSIASVVGKVRSRIRRRNVAHAASVGAGVGCFIAAVLACFAAAVTPIGWVWLASTALGVTVVAAGVGLCLPVSAMRAARHVDAYYALKDRAITAVQFEADADPIRRLQVDDARRHLRQVRPTDCVPMTLNRPSLYSAAVLATFAVGLTWFSENRRGIDLRPRPVALASEQATLLRETMLPELEQLRDQDLEHPETEMLAERMKRLIEEMETESIDVLDLMAKLSEMEQSVAEVRDSLQLEMTDAQLKGLAGALQSSDAMKLAAAAIQDERYEEAGEKLESIDPKALSDKERRAVADDLKKFLSKLSPGRQGKLSEAAGEILQGLQDKNDSQCKSGLCKLAGLCQSQADRKKIAECMACQLNRLARCKGACQGDGKNGGEKVAKSDSPSQSWGRGASRDPNGGPKTELDGGRRQEQLSGVQGDGPSESEVIEAPEGEQSAARAYVARYQDFRSQAEAVLDAEPLPLGHRETVRQYFENIRPAAEPLD